MEYYCIFSFALPEEIMEVGLLWEVAWFRMMLQSSRHSILVLDVGKDNKHSHPHCHMVSTYNIVSQHKKKVTQDVEKGATSSPTHTLFPKYIISIVQYSSAPSMKLSPKKFDSDSRSNKCFWNLSFVSSGTIDRLHSGNDFFIVLFSHSEKQRLSDGIKLLLLTRSLKKVYDFW